MSELLWSGADLGKVADGMSESDWGKSTSSVAGTKEAADHLYAKPYVMLCAKRPQEAAVRESSST
jgi:hypothetical protein